VLGLLAGVIGGLGGLALSWSLSRWVIHIEWRAPVVETLAGVALTTVLVGVVGLLASLDVLRRRPLATLRAE
jgi:predicted lysophospholipase L1 biosynthesis ABC-type transport system permease subunit